MQEVTPPLYNPLEEKVGRLEALVNRLLGDYRIGAALLGPLPESASALGLRRVSGYFLSNTLNTRPTLDTIAPGANLLTAVPFYNPSPRTVDRIAVSVTTGAGGNVRLGIYDSDQGLYPSYLLLDAGTVSTSSTGLKEKTIRQGLTRGLKWLVMVLSGTPTLRRASPGDPGVWTPLGIHPTTFLASISWSVTFSYAALPAKYPAGGAAGRDGPLEMLRFVV